jgi:hypothetical protein
MRAREWGQPMRLRLRESIREPIARTLSWRVGMGADTIPTILEPGGPLLSEEQCMVLLTGATAEGLCDGLPKPSTEVLAATPFRREWEDLLASIALFGPARAVLPAHLAAEVDITPLLDLGLAEIVTTDLTGPLRRRVAATYELTFRNYRLLEQHPATTPMRSINEPSNAPRPRDRLGGRMLIGDAEFYAQRLDQIITPFTTALQDIFGYYADANYKFTYDAIHDYVQATFSPADPSQHDLERRTTDLYASMGLYLRERDLLEYDGYDLRLPGISYNPYCLENFAELDREITSPPADFTSYAYLSIVLKQFDWADFISVHTYWRSFFELTNMLAIAELTENPLFLPSNASVRAAPDADESLPSTGDALRVYQMMLTETRRMPTPTTLRETEVLRRDPNLRSLRTVLNQWTKVARGAGDDDATVLKAIQADIELATRSLNRAELLGGIGKLVGLVSLPVTIVDLLKGSAWGASLAPIGPTIDRYGARQLRKAGWIRLGRP